MKLHLGVIEQPYVNAPKPGQKKVTASTVTTGDVAGWLEDDYEVMGTFVKAHGKDIADALAQSLAGSLESLEMGAPLSIDPLGEATSEIEHMFKRFIAEGEMDKMGIAGVPTQAAKDRATGAKRSSRKKNRKRGGNSKPVSFYDTGLYQQSFKAWVK